jgi:D-arabinose 1-dehydrogenase-like Zn-dependent alcohol dehydrogenase
VTATIAIHTMRAPVPHAAGDIRVEEVARPRPGSGKALIRVTLTTICGTDVHIVKGEYPASAIAWTAFSRSRSFPERSSVAGG